MPSITQTMEVDISDFTDKEIYEEAIYRGIELEVNDMSDTEIREEYNSRFGQPALERDTENDTLEWVRTYMNNGNYREALYKLETIIPEIRGLSEKIFK